MQLCKAAPGKRRHSLLRGLVLTTKQDEVPLSSQGLQENVTFLFFRSCGKSNSCTVSQGDFMW